MASRSGKSAYDRYDLSSDDEEYLMPNCAAKMTPGRSDHTACLLTAARLYLDLPLEIPPNWGQIYLNLNDYHFNLMEISCTFWILEITNWCRQQQETHSKYANLSNVACNVFSIIPRGVGVEARFSPG